MRGVIFIFLGGIALIIGLPWLSAGNDFFLYKTFAPKQEAVRRETFEQSKAFRSGAVQELQNMQFEYLKADDSHKAALASIIKHRAVEIPADAMPADLNQFVRSLP